MSVRLSCPAGISSQLVRRSSWCLISLASSDQLLSPFIRLMALDSILSRLVMRVDRRRSSASSDLNWAKMVRVAEVLVEGRRIAADVGPVPERLGCSSCFCRPWRPLEGGAWPARRRLTTPS